MAKFMGVTIPINTVKDFIINPLKSWPNQPALSQDLATWSTCLEFDAVRVGR